MQDVFPPGVQKVFRLVGIVCIVTAIVIPFRYFVAQPFIVSGASMVPTFNPNEYLVIDRLSDRSHHPLRGDVMVFKYPLDPSIYFIKRVIGLPGEVVRISDGGITIETSDGTIVLDEPYSHGNLKEDMNISLARDEYFMLGDSREASSDSRTWGPVKQRYVLGRPLARLFPINRIEMWPGQHE